MATITAEAKLYNGTRLLCVDKNITANLQSAFSLGNFNRPIQPNNEFALSANVLAFKLLRTAAGPEAIASLSLTDQRLATFGGGNKIGVVNPAQPWIVTSSLRCKFPTYVRFDLEALGVPQGTNIILELEEGFVIEGDYPGSERKALSKVLNLMAFRTPKKFASYPVGQFALPGNFNYRIRGVASSIGALFTPAVAAQANKAGVIELESFTQSFANGNYTAVFSSSPSITFTQSSIIGYLRFGQAVLPTATFNFITNNVKVRFFESTTNFISAQTATDGKRIRFGVSNVNSNTASNIITFNSRRRLTSAVVSSAFQSSATIRRIKQFNSTMGVATSVSATANKIGLLYEILNPNPVGTPAFDFYGYSVDVNETYFAVGAPQEDTPDFTDAGRVYVYSLSNGSLVNTLVGSTYNSFGQPTNDQFGYAVALNGDKIAVGSPFEDGPIAPYIDNGRVNVVNISNGNILNVLRSSSQNYTGNWTQGEDVAISNDYVVVSSRVQVEVYNRSNSSLRFALPSVIGGTNFTKVAISGDNIVVGYASGSLFPNYAVIYSASTGQEIRQITGGSGINFGADVAINGTFVAIGAKGFDTGGYSDVGRVFLYNLSNGSLVRTFDYPSPSRNFLYFGGSIALSDTHIVIGGDPSSADGHFHLFEIGGTRIRSYENGNTGLGDAVAIKGNNFIVGGIWKPSGVHSASGWIQVHSINKP